MLRKIGLGIVVIIFALFVWNTSLFTAPLTVDKYKTTSAIDNFKNTMNSIFSMYLDVVEGFGLVG